MRLACPHCNAFSKPDRALSESILKVLAEPDLPYEDYMLWIERQLRVIKYVPDYNGVKIHIGRKHKGKHKVPQIFLTEHETRIINREQVNV